MITYTDSDGDSNVSAYEVGPDYIKVQFKDGSIYLYNYLRTGTQNIEEMKRLARAGNGLNSFINTHVKHAFASKIR